MPDLEPHYRLRDDLACRLVDDLVGPVDGEEETLEEEPLAAYITGVLHARRRDALVRRDEAEAREDDVVTDRPRDDDVIDTGISLTSVQKPSAMGLTFSVDSTASPTMYVEIDAARYEAIDQEGRPTVAHRAERRGIDSDPVRWRRRPLPTTRIELSVSGAANERREIAPGLELRIRRRRRGADGTVSTTLSLVNVAEVGRQELLDPHCWFQPTIAVATAGPAVADRSAGGVIDDPDLLIGDLLHRHAPSFATGHGCSVDWPGWAPSPPGEVGSTTAYADRLVTNWAPTHEVLLTESTPEFDDIAMLDLATSTRSDDDVRARLSALVDAYEAWVAARTLEAQELATGVYGDVARDRVAECERAAARMRSGIARLHDDHVMLAFRLANETMAVQRARSVWIRGGGAGRPDPTQARWRPFQVGFVLLCLDGIVDPDHEDRQVADLLWFPTGGGKTEAYLGLIAFTTYLRRLRLGPRGAGVTVLMRYTLRLLTLQQFERASALICAMEVVRRRRDDLGRDPISIGMWVGRAATPNRLKDAQAALDHFATKGTELDRENPVQLTACPWCGTPIDHSHHSVDMPTARLHIRCPSISCEFSDGDGLPVHVVDEAIYAAHPTLIIATADKFAQMTWRADVASIFNRSGTPTGTPPPELIVQDELHLISGPLGTLAGLYEVAVDHVSRRPKVIASTATIRRADEQGRRLFDRTTRQFPPAGLDARDSWFAVEAPARRRATRRYVGVLAPGTSQATLLIRTFSSLLHHAKHLDATDAVRDAYWTLIGYFSSLRLLSAAELQVHADVVERLGQLAHRDGPPYRDSDLVQRELTSRLRSSEVPSRLRELFSSYGDDAAQAVDVVLATNMISVGVDVDRLGLMAVMGQPQTTAEYIQATSRVGRRDPGLVVTMFNASRSRDRSHYENFTRYHSALYRQVESTSVTPFAPRSRDRALHAALVAMVRMTVPQARADESAAHIETFLPQVNTLAGLIGDRAHRIGGDDLSAPDRDDVMSELEDFIDRWRELAASNPVLRYEPRNSYSAAPRNPDAALLRGYEMDDDLSDATETMWSLRDVDAECPLYQERR